MAFVSAAIIGAGASIYGANQAAGAATKAAKKSIQAQERQYQQTLAMQEPARYLGYQAMGDLAGVYGYSMAPYMGYSNVLDIGNRQGRVAGVRDAYANFYAGQPGTAGGAAPGTAGAPGQPGNFSRFFTSPDYEFTRSEGQRGIMRTAAARGGLSSGATLRALDEFNSGLASQQYGNWWNRVASMAGMNQTANSAIGTAGMNAANNIGRANMEAGDARASAYLTNAATIGNTINTGLNNWMLYRGGYFDPYVPPGGGSGGGGGGGIGGNWGA